MLRDKNRYELAGAQYLIDTALCTLSLCFLAPAKQITLCRQLTTSFPHSFRHFASQFTSVSALMIVKRTGTALACVCWLKVKHHPPVLCLSFPLLFQVLSPRLSQELRSHPSPAGSQSHHATSISNDSHWGSPVQRSGGGGGAAEGPVLHLGAARTCQEGSEHSPVGHPVFDRWQPHSGGGVGQVNPGVHSRCLKAANLIDKSCV